MAYSVSNTPNFDVVGETSVAPLERPSSSVATRRDGYVSVFEEPSGFEQYWRLAETLARSSFVPESFRGKTGDCLIALDLALSLGLKPTSLFPHLYVISGRPALSAQFLIALVNRSGKFSRIQWEEEEGAKITVKKATGTRDNRRYIDVQIPNYSARASFTETKTGQTLKSTKIDVAFAFANGWTSKDQSKWLTMPREMLRYRTASFLIKAYCPELIFGLEFAEDVEDSDAPTLDVEPRTSTRTIVLTSDSVEIAEDETESSESELLAKIAASETPEALRSVGEEIGAEPLAPVAKNRLRAAFKKRAAELKDPPRPTVPKTEPKDEQATEKKARRQTATKKKEAEKEDSVFSEIKRAATTDLLDEIGAQTITDLNADKISEEFATEIESALLEEYEKRGVRAKEGKVWEYATARLKSARTYDELQTICLRLRVVCSRTNDDFKGALKAVFENLKSKLLAEEGTLESGEEGFEEGIAEDHEKKLIDQIRKAKTTEDIGFAQTEIAKAEEQKLIDRSTAENLNAAAEARAIELEEKASGVADAPTAQQERYEASMSASLEGANSTEALEKYLKTIDFWRERNYLTASQVDLLKKRIESLRVKFLA